MFNESHLKPVMKFSNQNHSGYHYKEGRLMVKRVDHPYAWKNGYIYHHRLVMEVKLGRYLTPDEHVHHIDEDKTNNDPDNLMVTDMSEHRTIHNETRDYTSKWDVNELRSLYEQGMSNRAIAAELGISKSNVGYHIKKMGIARTELSGQVHKDNPRNQSRFSQEEIESFAQQYREGKSMNQIAREVGCSPATIHRRIHALEQ